MNSTIKTVLFWLLMIFLALVLWGTISPKYSTVSRLLSTYDAYKLRGNCAQLRADFLKDLHDPSVVAVDANYNFRMKRCYLEVDARAPRDSSGTDRSLLDAETRKVLAVYSNGDNTRPAIGIIDGEGNVSPDTAKQFIDDRMKHDDRSAN